MFELQVENMAVSKSRKNQKSGLIDNVSNVFYLVEYDAHFSSRNNGRSLRAKEQSLSATTTHSKRQVKRKIPLRESDVPCNKCHVKGTVFSLIM